MSRLRLLLSVAAGFVAGGSLLAAPTVQTLNPTAGATVNSLAQLAVTFSEPVSGVNADDLLINSESASSLTGSGAGPYVFTFTQPRPGTVNVAWDLDHGISGLGTGAFVAPLPWTYSLTDTIPPSVVRTTPASGATVGPFAQVEVLFSEEVSGVSADDLLLNGAAANSVTGSGLGPYVFTFSPAAPGAVTLQWALGHGIRDIATAPNDFGGGNWTATVSAAGSGNLIINEFLAVNGTGRLDEDGDPE
ncbi:MAG TPA: Ig-like domain-containing protein, partial [Chthoniobacteraceae bacterium]|nr:Ig-like domain-containing protein [Chthoniobacteraceae bacterium]